MASYKISRSLLLTTLIILALSVLFSCNKNKPKVDASVQFEVQHKVDSEDFEMDTVRYENLAGNPFSVTRLEYYLSDFTFINSDGEEETVEMIHYVNPLKPSSLDLDLEVPEGDYVTLRFHLGLPADENLSYSLPATTENVNMAWPDNMGGGYHFMKLEGHFKDDQNREKGYAMHLGMNEWLVTLTLNEQMQLIGNTNGFILTMDVNEWFENPHTYNFNVQGNYTMGIDSLMGQLSENGFSSFSITSNQ